jgi:branched-chain amino acid transport system substrate-binding protein
MLHTLELQAAMANENGGVEIGGTLYNIEIIGYDNGLDQTTSVSAANRLVYEDEVKFIIFDVPSMVSAWIDTTEENKVIVLGASPDLANELPTVNYGFNPSPMNTSLPGIVGWYCNAYPDEVEQGIAVVLQDNQIGHMFGGMYEAIWGAFGVTPTSIYYPPDQTDVSAVATQVKTLNPGLAMTAGQGGTEAAALFKAIWSAGYQGMLLCGKSTTAETLVGVAGAEAVEGLLGVLSPTEVDPAITTMAQEFKDAWIAEYGSWENPDTLGANYYLALITALQIAGSTDTDAVADVLANGLVFEAPAGTGQMVSRLDIGNARTVDCVQTLYMKQIIDGQPVLFATVSVEDVAAYFLAAYPPEE